MGTNYSHLSLDERIEIYHLFNSGLGIRAIARAIGRVASTVSRELARNAKPTKQYAGGYRPVRANDLAVRRRRWKKRFKMKCQPDLRTWVYDRLAMGWSPKQISGRLARDDAPMQISHESIYRYIYYRSSAFQDCAHNLLPRRKHRRGQLRKGGIGTVDFIQNRRPLNERPGSAADRTEPGHWEVDLMMFSKLSDILLVLHERTSRHTRVVRLTSKKAAHVAAKIVQALRSLPGHMRRTLTFDNGTEFTHHYKLHDCLGVETFFCEPRSPWQKGGVENAIGRMRRTLPRKSNLAALSTREINKRVQACNNTPRKCLDYETPNEIFNRVALQP